MGRTMKNISTILTIFLLASCAAPDNTIKEIVEAGNICRERYESKEIKKRIDVVKCQQELSANVQHRDEDLIDFYFSMKKVIAGKVDKKKISPEHGDLYEIQLLQLVREKIQDRSNESRRAFGQALQGAGQQLMQNSAPKASQNTQCNMSGVEGNYHMNCW